MNESSNNTNSANFGYKKVTEKEKTTLVNNLFTDVTENYDLMNDLMSFGLHRFLEEVFFIMLKYKKGR